MEILLFTKIVFVFVRFVLALTPSPSEQGYMLVGVPKQGDTPSQVIIRSLYNANDVKARFDAEGTNFQVSGNPFEKIIDIISHLRSSFLCLISSKRAL